MDATVVNVALPVIIEDLGLTATQAEWMNAVYSLMFAALLLTLGRVGDLYGRRKLFGVGMVVFVVASVAAGFSQSGAMLIAARVVQGAGAAAILPATLSTINAVFHGRERAIAFAVWGSTIGGMAALGPLVGGWLTTSSTWRWAFWINVPVGLLVLLGIVRWVPETRDDATRPGLDLTGVVLSAVGLGLIVFGLIEGQHFGWWRQDSGAISPVPVALAAGLLLMAAFVAVQRARARADKVVLVDLRLLGVRSFRYGSIAALVVALGEFGLLFTLPLLLQNALGYSALGTGWLIVSLAVGTFVASGTTPQLTTRYGGRAVVRVGLATEAVAVGLLAVTLSASISGWLIAAWLFPVRRRSRHGDRPAHRRDPRGDPGCRVRPGLRTPEHLPAAGLRAGCRHPGHLADRIAGPCHDRAPRRGRRSIGALAADRRRRHRFGRLRDPEPAGAPRDRHGGGRCCHGDDHGEQGHHRRRSGRHRSRTGRNPRAPAPSTGPGRRR